jgi:hypothetical protein
MNEKFLKFLNNDIDLYPSRLEAEYPHIFSKLVDLWETHELSQYLNEVVFDARGDRVGFNDGVGIELWKLHLHNLKNNSEGKDQNKKDYWDWVN